MPSIPQSLLWISLVVLWLFVLVPMLISKRDAVRRTSDVALATRVLNSGRNARLLRRHGPAAGHASDPDWRPSEDDLDEDIADEPVGRSVVRAAVVECDVDDEPDYLDVDVVGEDSGALPVGRSDRSQASETDELPLDFGEPVSEEVAAETIADETIADEPAVDEPAVAEAAQPEQEAEAEDDEYEYVDDSSGLEAPSEADLQMADSLTAARRRRYESKTAAVVSDRKYKFRKRTLTLMAVLLVASAAGAFTLSSALWWACGAVGAATLIYLAYLRRQTRIEERLRRRRAQRIARSRLGVENTDDREFDVVPSRLRRPGSVVLEIDDEDPVFEHLDYVPFARHFDLPRAAGE
ncbi:gephyrin-like molybdotransferase receptor GlpR [Mycobacterium sp. B14F4]|uniref:divisome protein SepX/GlpR n=1 Tax=Mycobacterium sp. B14F4 TaxID=3153565 RepID=UPI00325F4B5E